MEADPATARLQLNASSPPPFPAPAVSPPQQPQVEEERGAVECTDPPSPNRCAGTDPNPPPTSSPASVAQMPQQPKGVEAVVTSEVEQEEEGAVEGEGESLRSFLEDLGDQGHDCLIPSLRLKEITTPDRPAVLRFLGGKYNSLMERYKRLVAKCVEECAPRYDGLKKKYTDECAERRCLYNELIELRGNIRVFCRCRPLSADEVSRGCSPVVESDPSQVTELQFVPSEKERNIFKFDRVFRPGDDQVLTVATLLGIMSIMCFLES